MKKIRRAIAGLAAAALMVLPPWNEDQIGRPIPASEPDANVLGECEFDPGDAIIKVPIVAGTESCRFGPATSTTSLFRTSFAKKLDRQPVRLNDREKPGERVFFRIAPPTSVAGVKLEFPWGTAVCGSLSHLGAYWSHIDGVVGLDVLAQHIIQIDFDEGKIRFLRTIPEAVGERFEIHSLLMRPRLCAVTVNAQCCDEPVEEFYVELENPDAIQIRSRDYRRLVEKGLIRRFHLESTLGISRIPWLCFAGTAKSFKIGGFQTKDVRTVVGGDNVIGLGFLSRFVVTFDFPSGLMYLRPGRQFDRDDRQDISGLRLGWQRDSMVVLGTEAGSPADAAGLQENDVIMEVDGKPVNRESRSTFWKQLGRMGSTLRMRVKRGDDHVPVDLKLDAIPEMAIDGVDPPDALLPRPSLIPEFPPRSKSLKLQELVEPGEPENASSERRRRRTSFSARRQKWTTCSIVYPADLSVASSRFLSASGSSGT